MHSCPLRVSLRVLRLANHFTGDLWLCLVAVPLQLHHQEHCCSPGQAGPARPALPISAHPAAPHVGRGTTSTCAGLPRRAYGQPESSPEPRLTCGAVKSCPPRLGPPTVGSRFMEMVPWKIQIASKTIQTPSRLRDP